MSSDILTIATVFKQNPAVFKNTPAWKPEYVYRLREAIQRNLSIPFRFVCVSDVELDCETFPLDVTGEIGRWGVWYKMQLWRPEFGLTGRTMYIDLDTLIVDDFSDIVKQCQGHNFLMSNDPWRGDISCSAVMYWEGDHSDLWETFSSMPMTHWVETFQEAPNRRDVGVQQAFVAAHKKHKLIQHVIKNPNRTTRIGKPKKGPYKGPAALIYCSGNRKPWHPLMLEHPDVKKHWLGDSDNL